MVGVEILLAMILLFTHNFFIIAKLQDLLIIDETIRKKSIDTAASNN